MFYLCFKARQHLRSLAPAMNDFLMMMANDIRGWLWPKFSWLCLTAEEKTRKKPQPGKLARPGIEPGPARWEATTLPLDHSGGQLVFKQHGGSLQPQDPIMSKIYPVSSITTHYPQSHFNTRIILSSTVAVFPTDFPAKTQCISGYLHGWYPEPGFLV